MIERLRGWLLFIGLFAASFILGLYFTFPMSLVARAVEAQFERAVNYEYDLRIGKARWAGINGIHLQDVVLFPNGEPAAEVPILPTNLDRVTARVSLLSLLRGNPGGSVDIRSGDGRLWVQVTQNTETGIEVDARAAEFPLDRLMVIRERLGLAVIGRLSGDALLQYDTDGVLTDGSVSFTLPALAFGAGIPNIPALERAGAFVRLPATDLGEVTLAASIEESRVTLTDVRAVGSDLTLQMQGTIDLRDPFRASRVAVDLLFALESEYVEEADLGPILGRSTLLQRALTPQGYALSLNGLAGNLTPVAAPGRF